MSAVRTGFPIHVMKEERIQRGYTLRGLAKAMGEHENYIRKIEAGQRAVRTEEFVVICDMLGRAPSRMLTRVIRRARKSMLRRKRKLSEGNTGRVGGQNAASALCNAAADAKRRHLCRAWDLWSHVRLALIYIGFVGSARGDQEDEVD